MNGLLLESESADVLWGRYSPHFPAKLVLGLSRNTLFGRGQLRKLTSSLFARIHSGPVDVVLWGARVRLHPAINVVERKALMRPDHYDTKELSFLAAIMARPSAVFVDIGANAGLFTLRAALAAKGPAKIVSVEPDARLLSRLTFNLAQVRADHKIAAGIEVQAVNAAISDHNGFAVLASTGDEGGRALQIEGPGTRVAITTLADLAERSRISKIDVMKIDVEGHEDKVLPPFFQTVPKTLWPRAIIIEHVSRSGWEVDCIADALSRGYTTAFTTNNNTILERNA